MGLALAVGLPTGLAVGDLLAQHRNPVPLQPFTDGITYLAAGERLNDGHALYELGPDDRPVDLVPTLFKFPLLSPPAIAVAWRPLAAAKLGGIEVGLALWVVACWAALLGTVAYLAVRVGLLAVLLAIALALPIAQQLAVANVSSFFPMMLTYSWLRRGHPRSGVSIGVMAGIKLAPVVGVAWLVGTHQRTPTVAAALTIAIVGVLSIAGAGLSNAMTYLAVSGTVAPSPLSPAGLLNAPWVTYGVLGAGLALCLATGPWPRISFAVAVITTTIATPALYLAALVPLLALVAPLADYPGLQIRAGRFWWGRDSDT